MQWGIVERWSRDPAFPFQPSYTTATENADFNTVIAGYDPRTAIVVAFAEGPVEDRRGPSAAPPSEPVTLRPGTALAAMTVTAEPPPPQAHRARGH